MYVQNKQQRKQNENKVNEGKTVENIKYEPILSWRVGHNKICLTTVTLITPRIKKVT